MHRQQTLDTWQYMYVTGSGKYVPKHVFLYFNLSCLIDECNDPDPILGAWRQASGGIGET